MPGKVMLEVARLRPGRRRRVKFLATQRPELLQEVLRLFDVPDYYYEPGGIPDDFFEDIEDTDPYVMQGDDLCDMDDEIPF